MRFLKLNLDTKVTDAGMKYLNKMTDLQQLRLVGSGVTDKGVEELKKALPQVKVSR